MPKVRRVVWAEVTPNWEGCHLCGGSSLDGGHVDIDGREAHQDITCTSCGATWTEVYRALKRIRIKKGEPQ